MLCTCPVQRLQHLYKSEATGLTKTLHQSTSKSDTFMNVPHALAWCVYLPRCVDLSVTDITPPHQQQQTAVCWESPLDDRRCLSQAHGIHDILYWALCWKGENQIHHPYKKPSLKNIFVLFGFFSLFSSSCIHSFFHHHGIIGVSV